MIPLLQNVTSADYWSIDGLITLEGVFFSSLYHAYGLEGIIIVELVTQCWKLEKKIDEYKTSTYFEESGLTTTVTGLVNTSIVIGTYHRVKWDSFLWVFFLFFFFLCLFVLVSLVFLFCFFFFLSFVFFLFCFFFLGGGGGGGLFGSFWFVWFSFGSFWFVWFSFFNSNSARNWIVFVIILWRSEWHLRLTNVTLVG